MRSKTVFLFIFILTLSFLSVLSIPEVYAPFTYGNWNWDSTNGILTIIANASNNEGNSWANAYDCDDIVNSGVVPPAYYNASSDGNQFMFNFTVLQGDNTEANKTYFWDMRKQISFTPESIGSTQTGWEVKAYSYLRFGELIDKSKHIVRYGCSLKYSEATLGYSRSLIRAEGNYRSVELYGCQLIGYSSNYYELRVIVTNLTAYHVTFDRVVPYKCNGDFFDIIFLESRDYALYNTGGIMEKIMLVGANRPNNKAIYFAYTPSRTMKDVYVRGYEKVCSLTGGGGDYYFINFDSDTWNMNIQSTSIREVYRQYEFSVTLTFQNGSYINGSQTGARVVIQHFGENAGVDYNATLGEDGKLPIETLTKEFYNYTGGTTPYSYEPYNLYVYNISGYDVYNQNFTISQKTAWEIVLTPSDFTFGFGFGFILAFMIVFVLALSIGIGYKKRR